MRINNVSTLKINKLTQEQYDRELAAGRIDENAIYLTPDNQVDITAGDGIVVTNGTVSAKGGDGITINTNGINHEDTSSVETLTASERRYVTGLTFDDYGHVTGYTTGTETVTVPNSLKNPNALTIQANGTTLPNGTYDGSAAKTVNITPDVIGAAESTHKHEAGDITAGTLAIARIPTITLAKGGTNATSAEGARTNLSVYSKAEVDAKFANAGMNYTYGVEDLEPGVTELESGKLHFVYE